MNEDFQYVADHIYRYTPDCVKAAQTMSSKTSQVLLRFYYF